MVCMLLIEMPNHPAPNGFGWRAEFGMTDNYLPRVI